MRSKRLRRLGLPFAAMFGLTACGTLASVKQTFLGGSNAAAGPERLSGFIGVAVADEPRAALAGREVLALGGTAADAAVAMGFTMAVTLPSRAGLGGGGACLAFNPKRDGPGEGRPEAVMFIPTAAPGRPAGADRPASVPMLARGLFALHARYGKQPFESLLSGPEQLARFGVPVSRALARDLALVAGPLAADPGARSVFAPGGQALGEGGTLLQPDLGGTLSLLRTVGVGDLYQGNMARKLVDGSRVAGGPLALEELRTALPRTGAPLTVASGSDQVAFLPPPADGGLAAAAAFQALRTNPADLPGAAARATGAALRWRSGGGDPQAVLAAGASGGSLPPLPASAGFSALDRDGNAVACVTTMDNLFGTGRIAPGTGILLGASPGTNGLPLLAAALAYNTNVRGFRASVTGTGQEGAALAVAASMANALRGGAPAAPVPEPGRANAVTCTRYLPGSESACAWAPDPRGAGLAAASN